MVRSFSPDGTAYCDQGWIRNSSKGLWELYISGDPLELGLAHGLLAIELIRTQEEAFVGQLEKLIPSKTYRYFLQRLIAFFNRKLDRYVTLEHQLEIYGVSCYASKEFDAYAPAYQRILNYHAAHDIGHAMQNMNLVACTAFGLWDGMTVDSSLLIGRNFDFYAGDEFAENKIICFVAPDSGYRFAMVTWGGMTGVVSGMNEAGLTVTLNAAKSGIPGASKTPVSLVARLILQHAGTITEARSIIEASEVFVSESFLIGSAVDHKAVVIEKTPGATGFFDPGHDHVILTNHFQSGSLINDPLNLENMANETSLYRYRRVEELLEEQRPLGPGSVAAVLRDQRGLGGGNIGMGNEKAVNQLIAHHSVIFQPEKLRFWIALPPYQLGEYICYDLGRVFRDFSDSIPGGPIISDSLTIAADPFLKSEDWNDFLLFKAESENWRAGAEASEEPAGEYLGLNPEYYFGYALLGDHFAEMKDYRRAAALYEKALEKEVSSAYERDHLSKMLDRYKRRIE
jgi:hypothetical protein